MRRFLVACGLPSLTVGVLGAQVPTVTLNGQVYDAASRRAISQAAVTLRHLGNATAYQARTDSAGAFRVPALPPGRFAFSVHALGYRAHLDTLALTAETSLKPVFLAAGPSCLGECPADSTRMAAARARRSAWTCTVDSAEVASQRTWWANALEAPLFRKQLALGSDLTSLQTGLRFVADGKVCRRVGTVFERLGRLVDTTSTVFALGNYLLASQPGEHNVVLSKRYRVVYYFIWE